MPPATLTTTPPKKKAEVAFAEGRASQFKASQVEGHVSGGGASARRTSTYWHVHRGVDPVFDAVARRAADLVGVSATHVETLQIVRYVCVCCCCGYVDVSPTSPPIQKPLFALIFIQ